MDRKVYKVLDLVYNDVVYTGNYEDCYNFISKQSDYFTYKII